MPFGCCCRRCCFCRTCLIPFRVQFQCCCRPVCCVPMCGCGGFNGGFNNFGGGLTPFGNDFPLAEDNFN